MKKIQKISLVVVTLVVVLPVLAFIVDYTLASVDKRPLFVIPTTYYKDGGTIEYSGLGYKVIKYNNLDGRKDAVFISKFTWESNLP